MFIFEYGEFVVIVLRMSVVVVNVRINKIKRRFILSINIIIVIMLNIRNKNVYKI